jgi:signal transduction histidine kinase
MSVSPQTRPKIDYEGAVYALKVSAKQVVTDWQGDDVLGLLRAELLRVWTRSEVLPSARTIVQTHRALDELENTLKPRLADGLANSFAGQQSLNLVVELAHDLRSPLTSILSLAEILHYGDSGPVTERQRRQLSLIYESALQLSGLASNVIEIVRGGSDLSDDMLSPFSVSEILQSVQEIIRPIAEKKELTIRLITPPRDQRFGYPQALSRVLLNLTTNALKFTDKGFVEIAARARGLTQIEFSVRDTGAGIPEQSLATLYDPFRSDQSEGNLRFSGSGLGLAICRKLVDAMGSELKVVSGAWGTQFSFLLDLPLSEITPEERRQYRMERFKRITKPKRVTRAALAVAAAATVIIVAGTLISRDRRAADENTPEVELASTPQDQGVLGLEPSTVAPSTASPALPAPEEEAPTPDPTTAAVPASSSEQQAQQDAPVRDITPPPPGQLSINSTPWGLLFVDGELVGNTPKANVVLPAGTHIIRIVREGFEDYRREIYIESGAALRITDITLVRR